MLTRQQNKEAIKALNQLCSKYGVELDMLSLGGHPWKYAIFIPAVKNVSSNFSSDFDAFLGPFRSEMTYNAISANSVPTMPEGMIYLIDGVTVEKKAPAVS